MSNASALRRVVAWERAILGMGSLVEDAKADLSRDIEKQLLKDFSQGKDPYGDKWEATVQPTGHPLLDDTGRLKRSYVIGFRQRNRLSVTNRSPVARFHQNGTSNMAQRLLVPNGPLPETWRRLIVKAIKRQWKSHLARHGI